jgi:3-isopropylmalate dehydrogenase
MAARTVRLAVIGGDGIGPEVVAEAIKVLRAATVGVTI